MRESLIGQKFGLLTVVESAPDYITPKGAKVPMWKCVCECGNEVITRGSSLKNGHTKGCGQKHRRYEDLTGKKFGRLIVLRRGEDEILSNGNRQLRWRCRCDCGTERDLRAGTLKSGSSLSCGCYKYEQLSENAKHGFGISNAEKIVNKYLQLRTLYYEPQKIYVDLRSESGYPLSYDFLVYKDGVPYLLIECQGVHHYKPVEYFGGEKQFEVQCKNDMLKRNYAVQHGLLLLEIPYTYKSEKSIVQLLNATLGSEQKGLFDCECS